MQVGGGGVSWEESGAPGLLGQARAAHFLSNPGSASSWLCELGQVIPPLCFSFLTSERSANVSWEVVPGLME